jgi:hypothetical protein
MDTRDIDDELKRVAADFRDLLDAALPAEFRAPTIGTRWTNKQLLFHMLFGFFLVRALLPMVKGMARLPAGVSRAFAKALNACTRPFHVINYLSALPGATVLSGRAMGRLMDSTIGHIRANLGESNNPHSHSRCTSRSDGTPTSKTS